MPKGPADRRPLSGGQSMNGGGRGTSSRGGSRSTGNRPRAVEDVYVPKKYSPARKVSGGWNMSKPARKSNDRAIMATGSKSVMRKTSTATRKTVIAKAKAATKGR